MKIFIQVNEERVIGWGSTRGTEADVELEVEEGSEIIRNPYVYTYKNGELETDEVYRQQLNNEKEEQLKKPSIEQQLTLMQQALDDLILGGML